MTAEIVIVNSQAVALAADSAVTIGRKRVWKHANKLFSAGPQNDIGIMIYNSGELLSIPWESIVKEHRRSSAGKVFNKVSEFSADFCDFVKSEKLVDFDQGYLGLSSFIIEVLERIRSSMSYNTKKAFHETIISAITERREAALKLSEIECFLDLEAFSRIFSDLAKKLAEDIFEAKLRKAELTAIIEIVFEHLKREYESDYHTDIVIAGYGRDEMFPVVEHYIVDGKLPRFTRIWKSDKCSDLNPGKSGAPGIYPFAQADMAYLFMEGISVRSLRYVLTVLENTLNSKSSQMVSDYVQDNDQKVVELALQRRENNAIAKKFFEEFEEFRKNDFVEPVLDTIKALPKEEMAFMAKAMVEITALRRKFASSLESVGGDIDVAVISKSDGFIWINRKHYFDLDFNKDFLDRKHVSRSRANAIEGAAKGSPQKAAQPEET